MARMGSNEGDWTAHGDEGEGRRWVRGQTRVGVCTYQGGCEGVPRWVCGHTKVGVWAHQDGCEGTPRWV
jgi:hypothetical protein